MYEIIEQKSTPDTHQGAFSGKNPVAANWSRASVERNFLMRHFPNFTNVDRFNITLCNFLLFFLFNNDSSCYT
jgi:hypothetical protein